MTSRERVFALLENRPVDHLPCMAITMQFASTLCAVPYRAYATDYRVQADCQMRTAETFGLDYVSVISDPACEAHDLGAAVVFADDAPPALDETNSLLADKSGLARLAVPDPGSSERMGNRLRAVAALRSQSGGALPVEGWVEGPCAEAADLRGINRLMLDFMDDNVFVAELVEFVIATELRFAEAQVQAGADIIGIGDAAASLVGPRIYEETVQPAQARMVAAVRAMGARVRLHICGGTRRILAGMGAVGADIVDLDYPSPIAAARDAMGPDQVLLGNIDPVRALRDASPDEVYVGVGACHRAAGARYIVGAGCEVPRDTAHENLHAMVRYAREHTPDQLP